MSFTQEQIQLHNKFYEEACKLSAGEINVDGRQMKAAGWLSRNRLNRAKVLFEKTIAINPFGWAAMVAIGKIEQRFGHAKEALDWFLKAREFAPSNASLAKEASLTASQLGMQAMAARIADEAIELNPTDAALRINAGLAHLFAGEVKTAAERFRDAARLEPERPINKKLEMYAIKVLAGEIPKPKTEADIHKFVQQL
jgi:tetratricopeptide (TPR) repeat protein